MRIEAGSAEEYWAALPDDWRRETMERLRAMILEAASGVKEDLGYGMLRYGWGEGRVLCHLNAQARHVGLYLGRIERLDPKGAITSAYDCGKGCIRLRRRDDPAPLEDLIRKEAARLSP